MAVAHDANTESHTGTTGSASEASFSWSHTPAGTPKGVLVFTLVNANADDATSVTYGGSALTAVSGGRALNTTGDELGDCKAWFLGASIPTGAQTVVVNRNNNANVMWATAITVTALTDTEVYTPGIVLLETVGTLVEQNVDDGTPGTNSVRYAAVNSGLNGSPAAGANSTAMAGIDFGLRTTRSVRETTAGQGSRPVGMADGSSDDRAAVHLAIREAAAGAATVTPAVDAVTITLPTATILAAATLAPVVIPIVASLPTPSIAAAAQVTSAVIPVTVTLPTPTIVVEGGPVVTTPAVIAVTAALPTPSVLATAKVLPAVIPVTVSLPTPTIEVASSATVLPATIAVLASLPTPTITAASVVTPAGIALVVTVPTPSVTTPGLVTPAGISLIVTLPTPGTTAGAITFWTPDPVAFVPVGPGDQPPWN